MKKISISGYQYDEQFVLSAIKLAHAVTALIGSQNSNSGKKNEKSPNGYSLCDRCQNEVAFIRDIFNKWRCVEITTTNNMKIPPNTKDIIYDDKLHVLHKCQYSKKSVPAVAPSAAPAMPVPVEFEPDTIAPDEDEMPF